ncbi:uncharacterized protein METZ01_LOCUS324899 [marine metagenome]|uniref:Uncharacterized protein n=1 Tax=marine metagenome TaxID=408172 RepID=A0A382PHC6_9ZZZZ
MQGPKVIRAILKKGWGESDQHSRRKNKKGKAS